MGAHLPPATLLPAPAGLGNTLRSYGYFALWAQYAYRLFSSSMGADGRPSAAGYAIARPEGAGQYASQLRLFRPGGLNTPPPLCGRSIAAPATPQARSPDGAIGSPRGSVGSLGYRIDFFR